MLHLDLDAFFASVEQRDKPSLRGKPVVVGGVGPRGVVATASYEARRFGVRSAMPTHEARRRCPHAAFLSGRFAAYRRASGQVMAVLKALAPRVEPLSLDEAFVDLRTAVEPVQTDPEALADLMRQLKDRVQHATGGLTASVGISTSKLMAKLGSELGKPDGARLIAPGEELAVLAPLPVDVIPGVGPVTAERLRTIGVRTVADLRSAPVGELTQTVGRTHAQVLIELAFGRDNREVEPERETKSISVEDTFEVDLVDRAQLHERLRRDSAQVAGRLVAAGLNARTVTIKVRMHDFSTITRSRTLAGATDNVDMIGDLATSLLHGVDTSGGVRLLGVGVSGLTTTLQRDLFGDDPADPARPATSLPIPAATGAAGQLGDDPRDAAGPAGLDSTSARPRDWAPGADVYHAEAGRGWVWGSGLGRVTVRFEGRHTGPGPVRTFALDDPHLRPADPE